MNRERAVADVSGLPTVVFGPRNLVWWGTTGFAVIEGFSLGLCAVTYVYLRKNYSVWPPEGTKMPSLLLPTINMAIMLASLPLAMWTKKRAERLELGASRIGLILSAIVGLVVFGLRIAEFTSLNTQWNSNAYSSIIWTILGFHGTLILIDVYDTIGITLISFLRMESKWFPEIADNATYWMFTVLVWFPLYLLVYFGPRWL
ncbi:MAG TPA: cytochrome c oxidase subunit 3 [Gemmatimonadaceae bacterium]